MLKDTYFSGLVEGVFLAVRQASVLRTASNVLRRRNPAEGNLSRKASRSISTDSVAASVAVSESC